MNRIIDLLEEDEFFQCDRCGQYFPNEDLATEREPYYCVKCDEYLRWQAEDRLLEAGRE